MRRAEKRPLTTMRSAQLHAVVVKWFHKQKIYCKHATLLAADGGHLEMLKWLRANGYPWAQNTMAGAIKGGHLEVLKWLVEKRCPPETAHRCVKKPSEIYEWMRERKSYFVGLA